MKLNIKKIINYIFVENLYTLIIGIAFCILMSQYIGNLAFTKFAKYDEVKISISHVIDENLENTSRILDNFVENDTNIIVPNIVQEKKYGFLSFEQLAASIIEQHNISISYEEGNEYIQLDDFDSYVILRIPVYPNTCITLSTLENKYAVNIESLNYNYNRYISYENTIEIEQIKIYPYTIGDYLYVYLALLLLYILCFIILFFVVHILKVLLKKIALFDKEINQRESFFLFLFFSFFFLLFVGIAYFFNRERFQVSELADPYYYMYPTYLDENGKFSFEVISRNLYNFRGYITVFIAIIFNYISAIINIDVLFIYITYFSILIAYTFSYCLPQLAFYFTNKKSKIKNSIFMYGLFFLFWRNFFFYVLSDVPAIMYLMISLTFLFKYLQTKKRMHIFIAGMAMSVAISYRSSNVMVLYIFMFILLFELLISKMKNKETVFYLLKTYLLFFIGILLISIPQIILNYHENVFSLFPYQGGWVNDLNSGEVIPVSWYSFTMGFQSYRFGSVTNKDIQLAFIDQNLYMTKCYGVGDLLFIILSNPLEFIIAFFKRLIWALSIADESAYASIFRNKVVSNILLITNFVFYINFFIYFYKKKYVNFVATKQKVYISLLLFIPMFIQNLSHIEKRYFMLSSFLICFINCYILKNVKFSKSNLFNIVLIAIICFIIYSTVVYNFL